MTALQKLAADTRRYLEMLNQVGSCSLWELLFVIDYWVVVFHRLQEFVAELPLGIRQLSKIAIWCLKPFIEGLTGARIRAGARIGPGLVVFNSFGVTIATGSVLGANCTIYSGVFVAYKSNDQGDGVPVIGDGVVLMSGCKVLGGVTVGDGAIIGANSVVIDCVPSATIATGVPARNFRGLRGSGGASHAEGSS